MCICRLNLVANESHRTTTELTNRFIAADLDKNGFLDMDEARVALSHLGLAKHQQSHVLKTFQEETGNDTISFLQWIRIGSQILHVRPSVQYNLVTGWLYRKFLDRAHRSDEAEDLEHMLYEAGLSSEISSNIHNVQNQRPRSYEVPTLSPHGSVLTGGFWDHDSRLRLSVPIVLTNTPVTSVRTQINGQHFGPSDPMHAEAIHAESQLPSEEDAVRVTGSKFGNQTNPSPVQKWARTAPRINIFTGKNTGRHMGAVLDAWALLIIPTLYVIYLTLEFCSVIAPRLEWNSHKPHDMTSKRILSCVYYHMPQYLSQCVCETGSVSCNVTSVLCICD